MNVKIKPTSKSKPKKWIIPVAFLVSLIILVTYLPRLLRIQTIALNYTPNSTVVELIPTLAQQRVQQCLEQRLVNQSLFTPIPKLEELALECIQPLQFSIDKLPPNKVTVNIPEASLLAYTESPETSHYGILIAQLDTPIHIDLGSPLPQQWPPTSRPQTPLIVFHTTPRNLCCITTLYYIIKGLNQIPDLNIENIHVYQNLLQAPHIKIQFTAGPSLLMPNNLNSQQVSEKLSLFLSVYAELSRKGQHIEYIDLRFDRIIVR